MFRWFKKLVVGTVLVASLLGPGHAMASKPVADVQARTQVALNSKYSKQAQQYLNIVRQHAKFKTNKELIDTLNKLVAVFGNDAVFAEYCHKNFKCQRYTAEYTSLNNLDKWRINIFTYKPNI